MLVSESLLPGPAWTVGRITRRDEWADGLWTFRVDAPIKPYRAGQFLMLGAHNGEKWVKRAYSVASPCHQLPEFYVTLVADGEFTPFLHTLHAGHDVGITMAAQGHFTLELVPDAPILWLISTGTGLAPYIAMLRTEEPWQRFGRVVVVHGVRHSSDLAYKDELLAMSAAHDGRLSWVPVVTREPDATGVLHGRVPSALPQIEALVGAEVAPDTSQVLICGNPEMLKTLELMFGERGLKKNRKREPGHITTERYW